MALSSAMAELVVDSKEDGQMSNHEERVEQNEVGAEDNVSGGTFPFDNRKRCNS